MKDLEADRRLSLLEKLQTETYLGNLGELRWACNDAVVPLDVFADARIAPPAAQESARRSEVDAFLSEYRDRNAGRKHSAEELSEMRAAFGPGARMVNVITGQVTQI